MAASVPSRPVIVITGAGGMGLAIAQRLGAGKTIVLADHSQEILAQASTQLALRGHMEVRTLELDVSKRESVAELASAAASCGRVETVIHTAGLGPTNNQAAKIYAVNLIGTALVIEAFQSVIAPGGSMLCVASIAGHMRPTPPDEARYFALHPAGLELLKTPSIDLETDSSGKAYMVAKAANILRVKAVAKAFGDRGVRINSISPGLIATPMGHAELAGPGEERVKEMIAGAPIQRIGTVDDIVEVVAFLTGSGANWITGADLLIDGGAVAEQTRQTFQAEDDTRNPGRELEENHA